MINKIDVKNSNQGFTLLELLVVVLIICILGVIALPQYKKAVYKTRFTRSRLMLNSIYKAQQEYFAVHGRYAVDFSSLNIDLPKTQGTPTSYAFWNWGYCFLGSGYGGCGLTLKDGSCREIMDWSPPHKPCCYASKRSVLAQEICQAATGKTTEQKTSLGNDYLYSFQ